MKQEFIETVQQKMLPFLTNEQQFELKKALESALSDLKLSLDTGGESEESIHYDLTAMFLSSKKIEGCSEKSINYYQRTINHLLVSLSKKPEQITTEDLRIYLTEYQSKRNSSRVTIDNIRRILSSFFSWLEDEDYIIKSPVRRIHKVKTGKVIKDTYSDEMLEQMRDNCKSLRNLSIIDMLSSTA